MSSIRITAPRPPAYQRVEGQGVVVGFLALAPGHPLDLLHPVLLGPCALSWARKGLSGGRRGTPAGSSASVPRRAGEGAGLLIPLGDVELIVEGDQRRGHGVDDVVQVVLEAGELLLDLAAPVLPAPACGWSGGFPQPGSGPGRRRSTSSRARLSCCCAPPCG